VIVTCTSAKCAGLAEVTQRHAVVHHARTGPVTVIETSVVAVAHFSLTAPHSATVLMPLTSFGRLVTKSIRHPGLAVRVIVSVIGGTTVSSAIRILPPAL
jgi:hypothetical protein